MVAIAEISLNESFIRRLTDSTLTFHANTRRPSKSEFMSSAIPPSRGFHQG
jgi:hypothetical protein